jgi:hypothetical protein
MHEPRGLAAALLPITMTKLHNLTDTNWSTRVAWAETRFLFRKLVEPRGAVTRDTARGGAG